MREGGPGEQPPIISNIKKGPLVSKEFLGNGIEAAVYADTHQTEYGEQSYAYKEASSESEVIRIYEVYSRMREAGLPVVKFLKTHLYQDDYGTRKYEILMEDATEHGKYEVLPVTNIQPVAARKIAELQEPSKLRRQMIEVLAIIHNLGLYHSHPGISFFLKVDKEGDPEKVELLILDYSNFDNLPDNLNQDECTRTNLQWLLEGVLLPEQKGEETSLTELYRQIRSSGTTQLDSPSLREVA